MSDDELQAEIKAVKLLQERSRKIGESHTGIRHELQELRGQAKSLCGGYPLHLDDLAKKNEEVLGSAKCGEPIPEVELSAIFREAESRYPEALGVQAILSIEDQKELEERLDRQIDNFNVRYGLDLWDYAIAASCGLFAGMLDWLYVKAPPGPTKKKWNEEVDGVFNRVVQKALNKLLPPELSRKLSVACPIGAPDTSIWRDLVGAPAKALNPENHRLRSLAHDPVLGLIFGVLDMLNGTCTVVENGAISSFRTTKSPVEGNVFQLLGRMLGHLLSDVNAPSPNGNRGMGLPAPFMGLLSMFKGIPVGNSNFGREIEGMYVKGYDFRQFVVTSVPMAIMEVLLRAFYTVKQTKLHDAPFGETLLDTMPFRMNPRFRMILAMAYGTSSAVNAGKVYISKDLLNLSYASWMGLAWNGFHSLKWALLDKHLKLWEGIESAEIAELERIADQVEKLRERAVLLPIAGHD